jgi:DNA-directed RNA polymerase subunit RPC12/RpoP
MLFSMPCSHCGKNLKVRDELVGRQARCPYCRGTVLVARPAPPPAASDGAVDDDGRQDAAGGDDSHSGGLLSLDLGSSPGARAPAPAAAASRRAPGEQQPALRAKPRPAAQPVASGPPPVTAVAGNTDVSILRNLVFGILGTAAFYGMIWPVAWSGPKLNYLGRLFIGNSSMAEGGWVPIAEVFLFAWAISMMIEKYLKIRRQQRGMMLDVLPVEIGATIHEGNLDAFVSHIQGLPRVAVGSFLVTRCLRGIEHFRARRSAADTATVLSSQSELDMASVDSSYTMFHVFIWAIPILGFLGTVIGVSAAVGGFTGTLENSSDISALKEGLKSITSGLGTAFDTTLVALSMAMILTFPVSALQKLEGDVLGEVDEYTNEFFLRRLEDGRAGQPDGASRGELKKLLDAALASHRAELSSWSEQIKSLGTAIASDLQSSWKAIDERQVERLRETEASLERFVAGLGGIGESVSRQVGEGWERVAAAMAEERAGQAELLERGREAFAGIATDADSARDRAAALMQESAASVQSYAGTLERGLVRLAEVLEALGDKTLTVERPASRSWFGFGGRRSSNGRASRGRRG